MRLSGVIKWAPSVFSVLLISPLHLQRARRWILPSQNHPPTYLSSSCCLTLTLIRVAPLNPDPLAASFSCCREGSKCLLPSFPLDSTLFEVSLMMEVASNPPHSTSTLPHTVLLLLPVLGSVVSCIRTPPPLLPPAEVWVWWCKQIPVWWTKSGLEAICGDKLAAGQCLWASSLPCRGSPDASCWRLWPYGG